MSLKFNNNFFKKILFLFGFLYLQISFSQDTIFLSREVNFAQYLSKNKDFSNAIFVLKNIRKSFQNNDSLNFLIGLNFYQIAQFDSSNHYLSRVGNDNRLLFLHTRYIIYNGLLQSAKFTQSSQFLSKIEPNDMESIAQYHQLQIAGNKLLNRDFDGFNNYYSSVKRAKFQYSANLYNLSFEAEKYLKIKKKSMVTAGVLSAIVPGLGKLYIGRKGEFLGALLPILLLGGVAAESYVVSGIQSPHFILYSSLFTVFYVGNIWGSVISVKVKRRAANEAFEQAVLVNLQIPLDRIFK